VVPEAISPRSTTVTPIPRIARSWATADPVDPAPMINACGCNDALTHPTVGHAGST
jgi:hypothetical protein